MKRHHFCQVSSRFGCVIFFRSCLSKVASFKVANADIDQYNTGTQRNALHLEQYRDAVNRCIDEQLTTATQCNALAMGTKL